MAEYAEKPKLSDDVHEHVIEQLLGKSWGELEVLEFAGYLLFPDRLYWRTKDGEFDSVAVALRVPRQPDKREARLAARNIANAEGLDPALDRDLIDDLETVCLLSTSIRNATPPHESYEPDPKILEKKYDRACLMQLWAKLDALHQVVDPAPHDISEAELFALVAAVAKERSVSPLAVYAADLQAHFVITTACLLWNYLQSSSSSVPSDSSTQG